MKSYAPLKHINMHLSQKKHSFNVSNKTVFFSKNIVIAAIFPDELPPTATIRKRKRSRARGQVIKAPNPLVLTPGIV